MRTGLRTLAVLIALAILAFWFLRGANTGWTKNSVSYKEKDPVTELEVDRDKRQFVPGIDFLGEGLVVVVLVAGCSFFFRKPAGAGQSPG